MTDRFASTCRFAPLLLAAACAASVGDVDRTQPNYVSKSIFLPESSGEEKVWYHRATVLEAPTAGFSLVGLQGELERVVWEIHEQTLVAYRAHEHLKGAEKLGTRPGTRYRGAPVAAFPILSHFDIQREYNPATGEQTNVISENTTDRPWYEREYMRVDWGANQISDFRFPLTDVKAKVIHYVQPSDPDSADHPVVTDSYIDITTRLLAEPEQVEIEGYGSVPQCFFYSGILSDCLGAPVKVRDAFLRVQEDPEAYEPLRYDPKANAKFGYFATHRYVYDRERGVLEDKTEEFAERVHLRLKSRRPGADGQWEPIPYGDRSLRPIVTYLNEAFPRRAEGDDISLIEEAQAVADGWDAVFRDTVDRAWALGAESEARHGQKPNRIYFLCRNNPVTDDDTNLLETPDLSQFEQRDAGGNLVATSVPFPDEEKPQNKICGPKGLTVRMGDLRYSMQYWVPQPSWDGVTGYGPHAADPETGRVLQMTAHAYGAAMETQASYVADLVALMSDDLSEEDMAAGALVKARVEETLKPRPVTTVRALRERASREGIAVRARELRQLASPGRLAHASLPAPLAALRKGWAANYLVTDEIVKGLGETDAPLASLDSQSRELLSPARWAPPAFLKLQRDRDRKLIETGFTLAGFFDDSIWPRALKMRWRYKSLPPRERYKAIRRDLLKEIYVSTMLHEVGHTVGLRHNFAGSADALNYVTGSRPLLPYLEELLQKRFDPYLGKEVDPTNYWSLRPNMQLKSILQANEPNPLQPMYLFPFDEHMKQLYPLRELQYSSIMDYNGLPTGDFFGLGKYDYAAIRFAYTGLVDVFDPSAAGYPNHTLRTDLPDRLKAGEVHYTYLPYLFANSMDPKDMQKGIDLMVKGRRTMRYADLLAARKANPTAAPVEVPYLFCSDEYDEGSAVCYTFDDGPDMYEMVTSVQANYENGYWFNNFKQGRLRWALGGSVNGYLGRVMGRYFARLSNQYKHFVNDELIIRAGRDATCIAEFGYGDQPQYRVDHYVSPLCGLDQLAAAYSSLDFFGRVLATPDVGTYGLNPETGVYERNWKPEDEEASYCKAEVPLGVGKYAETAYSREQYGYDFYYKPVSIGTWWDKYLAVMAIGDPYTFFIGVDSGSDTRSYLINFADLFPGEVNNLVGGLVIGDFSAYAPRIDAQGTLHYRSTPLFQDTSAGFDKMTPLDPDEQFTTRIIAAYMGIAMFSYEKSDTAFLQSIKINVAGMGDAPAIPADVRADPERYVEIVDPTTHRTYWATRYMSYGNDGKVDETVIPLAFSLLKDVKRKVTDPKTGKVDASKLGYELYLIDILRGMVHDWEYVQGL